MSTNNHTNNRLFQYGIIVLTAVTALLHLGLAFALPDPLFTPLFVLNGIGYITLLILYLLPQLGKYRAVIRWLFIGFTAITIVGYFIANADNYNAFGLVDKAVEALLIVLLFLDRK